MVPKHANGQLHNINAKQAYFLQKRILLGVSHKKVVIIQLLVTPSNSPVLQKLVCYLIACHANALRLCGMFLLHCVDATLPEL